MSNNQIVSDYMIKIERVPSIGLTGTLKSALDLMSELSLGICLIQNENGILEGILTDGDLRRLILNVQNPLPALLITPAIQFGTRKPKFVTTNSLLSEAILLMDEKKIWDLPVLDSDKNVVGVLNRHNLD